MDSMDTLNGDAGGVGNAPDRLRIVLADDREDVLREIQSLLNDDFEIANSVSGGLALICAARDMKPHVVISDIEMPGINGIEACRRIIQKDLCKAAIILTMHNEAQLVREAFGAGIRGYVLK